MANYCWMDFFLCFFLSLCDSLEAGAHGNDTKVLKFRFDNFLGQNERQMLQSCRKEWEWSMFLKAFMFCAAWQNYVMVASR